jgi:hypothetical protein
MPAGLATIALPPAGALTIASPSGTPVGYGHDLSCTTDLDPSMLEVDGLQCLSQALFRRIITPRGTLIDDPNYGVDLTGYLNDDLGPADLARIGASVDAEFAKDERVFRSSTTITFLLNTLTVASVVYPSSGPSFRLVIGVGSVTAQILQASV